MQKLLLYSGAGAGGFLGQFLTAEKNLHGKTHILCSFGFCLVQNVVSHTVL